MVSHACAVTPVVQFRREGSRAGLLQNAVWVMAVPQHRATTSAGWALAHPRGLLLFRWQQLSSAACAGERSMQGAVRAGRRQQARADAAAGQHDSAEI